MDSHHKNWSKLGFMWIWVVGNPLQEFFTILKCVIYKGVLCFCVWKMWLKKLLSKEMKNTLCVWKKNCYILELGMKWKCGFWCEIFYHLCVLVFIIFYRLKSKKPWRLLLYKIMLQGRILHLRRQILIFVGM